MHKWRVKKGYKVYGIDPRVDMHREEYQALLLREMDVGRLFKVFNEIDGDDSGGTRAVWACVAQNAQRPLPLLTCTCAKGHTRTWHHAFTHAHPLARPLDHPLAQPMPFYTLSEISISELLKFLDLQETPFTRAIFMVMDEDKSGEIDFREFVIALWNYCTLSKVNVHRTSERTSAVLIRGADLINVHHAPAPDMQTRLPSSTVHAGHVCI